MCGITGFFSGDKQLGRPDIEKMTNALKHRGPDAEGFFASEDERFFLGHRRLSIVDLSTNANQPFYSACGNYVIVFNGEIYNFRDLVKEEGMHMKTSSDTEILIELYVKHGKSFISRLNGMFAFVIYELKTQDLFICRDRLGVKPLYYYLNADTFIFSSEIKSFLAIPSIKATVKVSKEAINHFLHLGYIPQPYSIFANIKKFPSGNYAVYKSGQLSLGTYWNPKDKIEEKTHSDEKQCIEKIDELLNSSISYRMIADVPSGTFLSGGIDSSIVTAIAARHAGERLKTFSIGFKESKFDESSYARQTAEYLKTDHHEFILSDDEAFETFESVIDDFDEPFADSSAIPTFMVSKLASKTVKVILTGDGGDELFMGYGAYKWAERLHHPLVSSMKTPLHHLLSSFYDSRYKRVSRLFDIDKSENLESHIFSQEQYLFARKEIAQLLKPINAIAVRLDHEQPHARILSPKERQALFDINYYLRDDLLVKVDRMSMLASIEAREPLLDYRLVEYALNIDQKLKIKGGRQKYILKAVLSKYLPTSLYERPKKGFSMPVEGWLSERFKPLMHNFLSEEAFKKTQLLEYKKFQSLLLRYEKGEHYLFNRIWTLLILNRWLIRNNISL